MKLSIIFPQSERQHQEVINFVVTPHGDLAVFEDREPWPTKIYAAGTWTEVTRETDRPVVLHEGSR